MYFSDGVNVRFIVGHFKNSKYNKGTQDRYVGELGWCVVSISFIWHRYHSNHTPKQCKPRTSRTIVRKIRWVGGRTTVFGKTQILCAILY